MIDDRRFEGLRARVPDSLTVSGSRLPLAAGSGRRARGTGKLQCCARNPAMNVRKDTA